MTNQDAQMSGKPGQGRGARDQGRPGWRIAMGLVGLVGLATFGRAVAAGEDAPPARWWKGNLHTHSLWSDGDSYPELVAAWYKEQGYHFLALSEHNTLQAGNKWVEVKTNAASTNLYNRYLQRFGEQWVERRVKDGKFQVRLRRLSEFRPSFEEPRRFLLVQSEEISDKWNNVPVHLGAPNVQQTIKPQGGTSVVEVLQRNLDAVLEQRRHTGQPMFAHVNHPNYKWALTAEELMRLRGARLVEVYNGHPDVHNRGDSTRAGTERIWDVVLAFRLGRLGMEPVYGLAVDDAHHFQKFARDKANPGRGWIMVRAAELAPAALVQAMESGDFYASTGVALKELRCDRRGCSLEIEPEAGVTYVTQFIGTRRGFNPRGQPALAKDAKPLRTTLRYGPDIGAVLEETKGLRASYTFRGDELYVRSRVISSKRKANAPGKGEVEMAWTQPWALPARP